MHERKFLQDLFLGDESAVELVSMLGFISQVWDDLIDRTPRSEDDIHRAFMFAICGLHQNNFFIQHRQELIPVLRVAILDWITATNIERQADRTPDDVIVAYVIRDSLIGVVVQIACLIGGPLYAVEHAPAIRRAFHDETFASYLDGLGEKA